MTTPSPLHHTTYAQRAILAALIRIGGSAKAADVGYEASHTPAYTTPMLDQLVNLGIVTRSPERPFPTYSTTHTTASIAPTEGAVTVPDAAVVEKAAAALAAQFDALSDIKASIDYPAHQISRHVQPGPDNVNRTLIGSAEAEADIARQHITAAMECLNRARSRTLRATGH